MINLDLWKSRFRHIADTRMELGMTARQLIEAFDNKPTGPLNIQGSTFEKNLRDPIRVQPHLLPFMATTAIEILSEWAEIQSDIDKSKRDQIFAHLRQTVFDGTELYYNDSELSKLPDSFYSAIQKNLIENPIFYKDFSILSNIALAESDGITNININIEVTMTIFNRSNQRISVPHRYSRSSGRFFLNSLAVNGVEKDVVNPKYTNGDGFSDYDFIEPQSDITIVAKLTEIFDHDDVQMYSCFDCGAEVFRVQVNNLSPERLRIHLQKNTTDPAIEHRDGNTIFWFSESALLPHQGVRLAWIKI